MDYHLFYTQKALSDLADIVGNIAADDAETASRFGNSLIEHVGYSLAFQGWVA